MAAAYLLWIVLCVALLMLLLRAPCSTSKEEDRD